MLEWVRQQRPNSKWMVDQVTNITFFITKIRGHPIGRGTDLPEYLTNNRSILPLDCNAQIGQIYNNNLCFFRVLALHNGCYPKNLERDTQHYYQRYRKTLPVKNRKFTGVTLNELPDLEHLFEVNIFVYSLELTKHDGEDDGDEQKEEVQENNKTEIVAQLIHRSLCHYPSTLYLNHHQHHFSFIRNEEIHQVLLLLSVWTILETCWKTAPP